MKRGRGTPANMCRGYGRNWGLSPLTIFSGKFWTLKDFNLFLKISQNFSFLDSFNLFSNLK